MSKVALITGASAGIGRATAWELAKAGSDLILWARREERLKTLASEIQAQHKVQVEIQKVDVCDLAQLQALTQSPSPLMKRMTILVNNAGLARGSDPVSRGSLADWQEMIDTNITALFQLTRLSLPLLQQNAPAQIINLGSVAGRWVYPGGAVYCATKHAVRAFTEGLRMDLLGRNIRVTNISPGMVETEFSEVRFRDPQKAKQVYQGMTPLSAQDIAETIAWCVSRPPHINVQELILYPTEQASVRDVHRN